MGGVESFIVSRAWLSRRRLDADHNPSSCPSPAQARLGELASLGVRIRERMRMGEGTPLERARPAPSPLAGEGWGEGFLIRPQNPLDAGSAHFPAIIGKAFVAASSRLPMMVNRGRAGIISIHNLVSVWFTRRETDDRASLTGREKIIVSY
jgi:hypothetical protein